MAMNPSSNRPPARRAAMLILLPTELQQAIFSQVEDIRTLTAIAASCRSLRNLLLNHSTLVIKQVIARVIPTDVLPEAIAVHKSCSLSTIDHEIVQGFLHDYFASLKHLSHPWSLNEAAALERFHQLVQLFTADFIARALSKNPATGASEEGEPSPTSERELCRIQRAFYRFELYCKLFKGVQRRRVRNRPQLVIPLEDQSELFFHHFAPWENEQLGCIHDFLLRAIDEAYDDVAAHDVVWGEMEVPYYEGYKPGWIWAGRSHCISLGLGFIHRLSMTKDYENRRQKLNASKGAQYDFLDRALLKSSMSNDNIPLSDYDEERLNREVLPPAIADPDAGPAEVWRVTHLEKAGRKFVMANNHVPLRERGYVMWDYERLAAWGMLNIPWQPLPARPWEEIREQREKVLRSHVRRTEIWLKGGSGWWSEHDESKVVYQKLTFKQ